MTPSFTAVALISAYNEADIIGPVIDHAIQQGLFVYLLDHGSTDATRETAAQFVGRGLIGIEPFPSERFAAARDRFAWQDILARKQELARDLQFDWFIHHDADEFRESPWDGVRLLDAIQRVDRLGYNAIDFELFDFVPTDNGYRPGDDPRPTIRHYEPARTWNKSQVKCWKRQDRPTDLVSSGGHDVTFPGRKVFPIRFILRHYPIRSDEHGARKVFAERLPRMLPVESARGWHVQYNQLKEGDPFVRDPASLIEFDAGAARVAVALRHRDVEALETTLARATAERATAERATALAQHRAIVAERDAAILGLRADVAAHQAQLAARHEELVCVSQALDATRATLDRLVEDVHHQRDEIDGIYASKSWRWTAALRAIYGRLTGRRST